MLAAEPPDDPSGVAVDLVDGPGVATRDEQVAVGGEADRVDVEVVVGRAGVLRDRLVAVGQRHVVKAVPVEQHSAGAPRRPPGRCRRRPRRCAGRRLRRGRGGSRGTRSISAVPCGVRRERVLIGVVAVTGMHSRDDVVRGVGDHALALAVAGAADAPSLPPGEDRPALVALEAEVARHLARRQRPEPHRTAEVVDDQRAGLLAGRGREVLGAEEDQPRSEPGCSVEHGDLRRPEVGQGARRGGAGAGRAGSPWSARLWRGGSPQQSRACRARSLRGGADVTTASFVPWREHPRAR